MRRAAYTYIEMLMVVAVIGILVALLLPAIQAAREAARRSNCSQNLQQLALAIQTYEVHHSCYPPGTIDKTGPILSQPVGYHHSWITQILPYLEQANAFHAIDRSVGVYDPKNSPVRRLQLDLLLCPSAVPKGRGYSDYAAVHNDIEAPIDATNNGVFFLNSHVQYEDLLDGSSQTLFIGEKFTLAGDLGWMSGTRATLRNAGSTGGGIGPPVTMGRGWRKVDAAVPRGYPPDDPAKNGELASGLTPNEFLDFLLGADDRLSAPAGQRLKVQRPRDVRLAVGSFGSVHPGGSQFAWGDGSIRFLSSAVTPVIFVALANRADGQIMDVGY